MKKQSNLRAATDDLLKTVQSALENKELNPDDRDWLIQELDDMMGQLKSAKKAVAQTAR